MPEIATICLLLISDVVSRTSQLGKSQLISLLPSCS
jgi:hypothetical protein